MPNVVLEASVVVSATLSAGRTAESAILLARVHDALCWSAAVLDEIGEVLQRPKIAERVVEGRRVEMMSLLTVNARRFRPRRTVRDCRDPKDDKYLELALEAGAWAIVSGDQDLLVLDPWRGVRILTPAEYVRLVSEREGLSPP
jgi:hypothetical protein